MNSVQQLLQNENITLSVLLERIASYAMEQAASTKSTWGDVAPTRKASLVYLAEACYSCASTSSRLGI